MESKTLVEKTADRLMLFIQTQSLKTGDRLPPEPELIQMLGVSRNTVREATKMLVSQNVLDIRQGAGTFLSDKRGVANDPLGFRFMEEQSKLTRDLLEIRCIIEPPLAALAAQHATPHELHHLNKLCHEVEVAILDGLDFNDADQRFHAQIATCSHNLVMSNLLPIITEGVSNFHTKVIHEFEQTIQSGRAS
ncbi:MAG: GntR family transcriptional regulator, partial [Eubacteriales bacterium]